MKAKLLIVLAGIAMLAACKGRTEEMSASERFVEDSAKVVKKADMRFKVRNVQKVSSELVKLVTECGGTVMHNNVHSDVMETRDVLLESDSVKKLTVYNTNADLVLKVPTEVLSIFMDSLSKLSIYVDESKMDVEDRTLEYLSQKLKAENRVVSVKQRRKIKLSQGGADSVLALKDDIVDKTIANLRTNQDVKYSTLSLNLYQANTVHAEVVANDDLSTYKTPFSVRFKNAFGNGWSMFSELMIGVFNLWVFILAGAMIWVGARAYRKRKKITGAGA